jgi:hypothetical protein
LARFLNDKNVAHWIEPAVVLRWAEETNRMSGGRVTVAEVLNRLVVMIHGAQIVETHHSEPCFDAKVREHAEEAEKYISQHSKELGLKMVKFVYDDSETQSTQPETRRKRPQSPSYEI